MFENSVFWFSLMSQELIEFLIVKISLILLRYDIKCNENTGKKVKMHC
jgi:hypothetical protein